MNFQKFLNVLNSIIFRGRGLTMFKEKCLTLLKVIGAFFKALGMLLIMNLGLHQFFDSYRLTKDRLENYKEIKNKEVFNKDGDRNPPII